MSEPWWKSAVIYQIYPRSFMDSNGDGVGDLEGVRRRLDHLTTLGVDALWLSPIYPSPMADFGYDVSDYEGIDPAFGSLADFDRLLAAAHDRGLKVILDYVPNHSSSAHPWFIASRASRTNPKRDWYIWRDPAPDGGPPNNWISDFGGSAWSFDEATGQYYLHAFLKEQPDLNWRNPEVRAAMLAVLDFWLDRGVDGFRIDVLWHLIKDEALRDNPPNPDYRPSMGEMHRLLQRHSTDQPEVHALAAEMRRRTDRRPGDPVLIGEIYLPVDKLVEYYGRPEALEVHLPFNFQLIELEWSAQSLKSAIGAYEAALPADGWPNWVLGNHDRPRIADRVGEAQARVAAVLLLTLRGTPTLYYGDEIALGRVDIPPAQVKDPRELREPGLGLGRDPVRTPMPWSEAENGGFTTGAPWLPLNPDWRTRNVAAQTADPGSLLNLYRRLTRLRRDKTALRAGSLHLLETEGEVLGYERRAHPERLVVLLNLGAVPRTAALPRTAGGWRALLSSDGSQGGPLGPDVELAPNQALILEATA